MKNNQRAVTQIVSWLSAAGIPCVPDHSQGSADLVVVKKDGGLLSVLVSTGSDARDATGVDVVLRAEEVMGRYIDKSIVTFHTLTEAAGYGRPSPVDRGAIPLRADGSGKPKNLRAESDFELVAMRHKELRRAPNPPPGALEKYTKILENICWNFIKLNSKLCHGVGLEHGDLMTYARIYATNFIGLSEKKDGSEEENKRLLTMYVRQKLSALRRLSFDKIRSCTPDMVSTKYTHLETGEDITQKQWEALPLLEQESYHKSVTYNIEMIETQPGDFISKRKERALKVDMEGYIDGSRLREQALQAASKAASTRKEYEEMAREIPSPMEMVTLKSRLDELEHDQLVAALQKHTRNKDEDVADVARSQLALHKRVCVVCSS